MNSMKEKSMGNTDRVCVCILGMHRSGTSMLAGLVNQAGYEAGKDLMGADDYNTKGHYENIGVYDLNERMLAECGSSWDDLSLKVAESREKLVSQFLDDAVAVVQKQFGTSERILIKDPRNCLLLPVWSAALEKLGIDIKVIIIGREPVEVAYSLKKRNEFSVEKGLQLWCSHSIFSEYFSRGMPRVYISYEDILNDVSGSLQRIDKEIVLGIQDFSGIDENFANRSLRHQVCTVDSLDRLPPAPIPEILEFSKLGTLDSPEKFDQLRTQYVSLNRFFITKDTQITSAEKQKAKEKAQYLELLLVGQLKLNAELGKRDREIEALKELGSSRHEKDRERDEQASRMQRKINLYYELSVVQNESAVYFARMLELVFSSSRWKLGDGFFKGAENIQQLVRKPDEKRADLQSEFHAHLESMEREAERIQLELDQVVVNDIGGNDGENDLKEDCDEEESVADLKERYTGERMADLEKFLASKRKLRVPRCEKPKVSVILVLYNRAELTFQCIESIIINTSAIYELLIVDNASSDSTQELLGRVEGGVRLFSNTENVGFLYACNQAAKEASGDYILLLNNDAEIHPRAIENSLSVFEEEDGVGAVGGKITLLDGLLQEAGSIIWNDGSCAGYGRGEDPENPEFNFRRDVDYCSGAFLMTPLAIWNKLGGFDTRYAPAYYEETDYCVTLREQGLRIVYDPSVQITHFEFASQDALEQSTRLELMVSNQEKFLNKHAQFFADNSLLPRVENFPRARIAKGISRVLYIDDRVPHVSHGAGFPRSNFIVNTLCDLGFSVTFVPMNFSGEEGMESAREALSPGIEVRVDIGKENFSDYARKWNKSFDLVWVSRPHNMESMLEYIDGFKEAGATIIYDAEAIFSLRDEEKGKVFGVESDSGTEQSISELSLIKGADKIVSVSEREAGVFREHTDSPVFVLGHSLPYAGGAISKVPFESRSGLLFVGNMDHDDSPNVDSIEWFVDHVWERVQDKLPDINLFLVGSSRSELIGKIGRRKNINVFGRQDDLSLFFDNARVFIAPTRYSAGVPHKLHEAASRSLPIMCTNILADQLGWSDGVELRAADWRKPDEFADALVDVYSRESEWERLQRAAFDRVKVDCDSGLAVETLKQIVAS